MLILVSLLLAAAQPASFHESKALVPMRDGINLSAQVYRPNEAGRVPAILVRTPYGKGSTITPNFLAMVDHGYAVVVEDVRGRYESEGVFNPLTQEPSDGYDTINWIAAQPWSDGKVGMMGGSYVGIVQWQASLLNNPHLKAIFPVVSGDDDYRDRFYSPGGAMKLGHRMLWLSQNMRLSGYKPPPFSKFIWTLPTRRLQTVVTGESSPMLDAIFDHPSFDSFWEKLSTRAKLKDVRIPVFAVAGWYDNYAESDLDAFSTLQKHNGASRIVIGPWPHNMSTPFKTIDFGLHSGAPIRTYQIEWFDQWLKGKENPGPPLPPVRLFVMGANVWRDENEWPLARSIPTHFYLESAGHANTANGDGELGIKPRHPEPPDHFTYDPAKPVPTMGGSVCCTPEIFPWGPMDQRPIEKRRDVLVYDTEPLRDDVEVTGPITLTLFASTTAVDTDFTAKLTDVYPDGRSINLTDGILRARYRDSLAKPRLLVPNEISKYAIDLGVTSNLFKKGHRIRLEVSSSNFPRFDRNPNTGRPIADEARLLKAQQTIFHDPDHSSYLLLPVIPVR